MMMSYSVPLGLTQIRSLIRCVAGPRGGEQRRHGRNHRPRACPEGEH